MIQNLIAALSKVGCLLIVAFLLALPTLAFAEGEGAEPAAATQEVHGSHEAHEGGIPMSVVWQAINFALYAGVLVYYTRHPIKNFFTARHEAYKAALVRGEQARRDAETKKREIQDRLNRLEKSTSESVNNAKAEAAQLVQQIHQQGEELSKRLRDDASRAATMEIERAQLELRTELLNQAVELSRKILEDKDQMKETDQKRLQTEFVTKIQEVRG